MNYLLDTHILLWALSDNPKLPDMARRVLLDKQNTIFYSFVNVWEVAIKYALKKPDMEISPQNFELYCMQSGYLQLKAESKHVYALAELHFDAASAPRLHRDPFDRLLLAQSKAEQLLFLTHDELIAYYHEPCVVKV